MEPCAPGTEDDPPIMYSTLNKRENEQERLLSQKAILKNGRYEHVFELSFVNGAEFWYCKICECPVMGRVFQHEMGKRHTQRLQVTNRHKEEQEKQEEKEESVTLDIAPGEPVPPGFEGEIERVAQIQDKLDGFKVGPLIALEYLVELQDYDPAKEPVYLCILCDKKGDPRTVLTHLASYNHISQYLQRHFPTCWRTLAPYMTKQYKRNWQVTLPKIAEGIEKKFGRLKPFPVEKDKFENERMHFLQKISRSKHFSEQSGYTFEELVVHDELTKVHEDDKNYDASTPNNWGGSTFIQKPFKKRSPSPPVVAIPKKKRQQQPAYVPATKTAIQTSSSVRTTQQQEMSQSEKIESRKSMSSVSSVSSDDLSDIEQRNTRNASDWSFKNRKPAFQCVRNLPYERRKSQSPGRKPSPSRRSRNPRNERESSMDDDKMEKLRKVEEFRKLARAIENDMHRTLKQHEKNPEKHPQYNDEWKKFWNRRYKELQAQGVDASKHDFKPEWIEFWNKKVVEFHSDELRNRKEALRKRLGLPEEINPIKFKINATGKVKSSPKPNLPMTALPDQDNDVIIIDDKDDDRKRGCESDHRRVLPIRISPKRRSLSRSRSRERRIHNRRDEEKRRNVESRLHRRSPLKRSPTRRRSKSFERSLKYQSRSRSRSKEPSRPLKLKDRRSISRERKSLSKEKRSPSREKRMREYRESSFERDLRGKERIRTVADLPWEREKAGYRPPYSFYDTPKMMREVTRKPMMIPPEAGMLSHMIPPQEEDEDDGEINVVDVLRILTALEDKLGSLGPKVIDLLAQALALEKKEANSSEKLLDNDLNCVLFETVKEKLKGQLLAGLVVIMQERAFKKAIKKIAGLIHLASERKKQRERYPKAKEVSVPPGVGAVDKAAIAKQIANALILQGKTDVTQAELEQLINAVVGMAEASKNSGKPMTTATFLQKISQGGSINKIKEEFTDKIIIPSSVKKLEMAELDKLTEPLTPSPGKKSTSNMENLSDTDLQTLLQNFKDLSTDEQHNLINYLKKLELYEPQRVEKLRQFVNLEPSKSSDNNFVSSEKKISRGRDSPFSCRLGSVNPASDDLIKIESEEEDMDDRKDEPKENEQPHRKIHVDSEEEDYTFEDVVKSVSKSVKNRELESNMKIVEETMKFENNRSKTDTDLSNAKDLISNLMGNINKNTGDSSNVDLLGLGDGKGISANSVNVLSNMDFAKTLSSINVSNLANIVNSVKNMSSLTESGEKKMNFQPPERQFSFESRLPDEKLSFDPAQLNRPQSPSRFGNNMPSVQLGSTQGPQPLMSMGGHMSGHLGSRPMDLAPGSFTVRRPLGGSTDRALLGPRTFGSHQNPMNFDSRDRNFVRNPGQFPVQNTSFQRGVRPNLMDQRMNPRFNNFSGRW